MKIAPLTIHISKSKGFKNNHVESSGLIGTIIDNPDSAYGWVNSTYFTLSASIVISPMAAS